MKLVIFHPQTSISNRFGYSSSIRMAYLLNGYVAAAGINENVYFFKERLQGYTLDMKIKHLKDFCPSEEVVEIVSTYEAEMKVVQKLKSKSSQDMVYLALVKREIDFYFDDNNNQEYDYYDDLYKVKSIKDLISPDVFYFYSLEQNDRTKSSTTVTPIVDLLQLLLPDPEREHPLFFMNLHNDDGTVVDLPIYFPPFKEAEDPENFYGHRSFIFPMLTGLSSAEIRTARSQMTELTEEFRRKIDQWAEICYRNPISTEGVEFFRSEMMGHFASLRKKALETPILKNVSDLTTKKDQTQLIIGQMPIEKIWRIYRDTNSISENDYNELVKIKAEQYPKYEGRWPVIFCTLLEDSLNRLSDEDKEEILSLRKSISVDDVFEETVSVKAAPGLLMDLAAEVNSKYSIVRIYQKTAYLKRKTQIPFFLGMLAVLYVSIYVWVKSHIFTGKFKAGV